MSSRGELGEWAARGAQVECLLDGRQTWDGEMVCSGCGWLYRIRRAALALEGLTGVELDWEGPTECGQCGAMLIDDTPVRGIRGTARICCSACFARAGGAGKLVELLRPAGFPAGRDPNEPPN